MAIILSDLDKFIMILESLKPYISATVNFQDIVFTSILLTFLRDIYICARKSYLS